MGNMWIIFENWSTMPNMASFPWLSGSGSTISKEMIFHGVERVSFRINGVCLGIVIALAFWHFSHPETYCSVSFQRVARNNLILFNHRFSFVPDDLWAGDHDVYWESALSTLHLWEYKLNLSTLLSLLPSSNITLLSSILFLPVFPLCVVIYVLFL